VTLHPPMVMGGADDSFCEEMSYLAFCAAMSIVAFEASGAIRCADGQGRC